MGGFFQTYMDYENLEPKWEVGMEPLFTTHHCMLDFSAHQYCSKMAKILLKSRMNCRKLFEDLKSEGWMLMSPYDIRITQI